MMMETIKNLALVFGLLSVGFVPVYADASDDTVITDSELALNEVYSAWAYAHTPEAFQTLSEGVNSYLMALERRAHVDNEGDPDAGMSNATERGRAAYMVDQFVQLLLQLHTERARRLLEETMLSYAGKGYDGDTNQTKATELRDLAQEVVDLADMIETDGFLATTENGYPVTLSTDMTPVTDSKEFAQDLVAFGEVQMKIAGVQSKIDAAAAAFITADDGAADEAARDAIDVAPLRATIAEAVVLLGASSSPDAGTLRKQIEDTTLNNGSMFSWERSEIFTYIPENLERMLEAIDNMLAQRSNVVSAKDAFATAKTNFDDALAAASGDFGALTETAIGLVHESINDYEQATFQVQNSLGDVYGYVGAMGESMKSADSMAFKIESWANGHRFRAEDKRREVDRMSFSTAHAGSADHAGGNGFSFRLSPAEQAVRDAERELRMKAEMEAQTQQAAADASMMVNEVMNIIKGKRKELDNDGSPDLTMTAAELVTEYQVVVLEHMQGMVLEVAGHIQEMRAGFVPRKEDGSIDTAMLAPEAVTAALEVLGRFTPSLNLMGMVFGAQTWLKRIKKQYGPPISVQEITAGMDGVGHDRLDPANLHAMWTLLLDGDESNVGMAEFFNTVLSAPTESDDHAVVRARTQASFAQTENDEFVDLFNPAEIADQTPALTGKDMIDRIIAIEPDVAATAVQARTRTVLSLADAVKAEFGEQVKNEMVKMQQEMLAAGFDVTMAMDAETGHAMIDFDGLGSFNDFHDTGFSFDDHDAAYVDEGDRRVTRVKVDHTSTAGNLDNQFMTIPYYDGADSDKDVEVDVLISGDPAGVQDSMVREIIVDGAAGDNRNRRVKVFVNEGGQFAAGNGQWSPNSSKAVNILGEDAMTIAPDGSGTVHLNANLIVTSNQPLLPTKNFGRKTPSSVEGEETDVSKATDVAHVIRFTSNVPREIRVLRGVTFDLTGFGAHGNPGGDPASTDEWYSDGGKTIMFDDNVRLVFEPGSSLRFPYMPSGKEAKAPTLLFKGESQLICMGRENQVQLRWDKGFGDEMKGSADDQRCKFLGVGTVKFDERSKMFVNNSSLVSVEADQDSPRTAITFEAVRSGSIFVGDQDIAGGGFQVGNVRQGGTGKRKAIFRQPVGLVTFDGVAGYDRDNGGTGVRVHNHPAHGHVAVSNDDVAVFLAMDDSTFLANDEGFLVDDEGNEFGSSICQIDCTIKLDGPRARFHIGREGFLGFATGTVNKAGCPNGALPEGVTTFDGDEEQYGAWRFQSLHDVRNINVNVNRGTFSHNQIADGSNEEGSLWAIGPVSGLYCFRMNLLGGAHVLGGGNMMYQTSGVAYDAPQAYAVLSTAGQLTGTDDDGTYGMFAGPSVVRSRTTNVGRTDVAALADSYTLKSPAEEFFLMLTLADYSAFPEKAVPASVQGGIPTVGYVNSDADGNNVIVRAPVSAARNTDGVAVDPRPTISEDGEMLGNRSKEDGAPGEFTV